MAVYKVIQDIEAEDKIVGFLSLKSFIYAMIAVALGYVNFRFFMAGTLGPLRFVFMLVFFFPMMIFGILAAPLGRDQPTEVWILSHVRFFLKNRKRVWDQAGAQELVTVTAPKRAPRPQIKNLNQSEVASRLKALATTLDSRGWAVKNVAVNLNTNPSYLDVEPIDSDRLISPSSLPQQPPDVDVNVEDDIMDEQNNPTAIYFNSLMKRADVERKKEVRSKLDKALQQKSMPSPTSQITDSTFLDQVTPEDKQGNTSFVGHKIFTPGTPSGDMENGGQSAPLSQEEQTALERIQREEERLRAQEAAFLAKAGSAKPKALHSKKSAKKHAISSLPSPAPAPRPAVTTPQQNAKLKELMEVEKNDKISTLEKQARRMNPAIKEIPGGVEIDFR